MVTKMFALGLILMMSAEGSPLPSVGPISFSVGPISVMPSDKLKSNHSEVNYTIEVGADVRLSCKLTYDTGMHWFIDWEHHSSTNQHTERNHWGEGYAGQDYVTRDLYIKEIESSDSGSYKCLRKKRGGAWERETPIVINITVGK